MEELRYKIDVLFQEKILTNNALVLIWSPASRALIFGWVIVLRQLHFHIYNLFVERETTESRQPHLTKVENMRSPVFKLLMSVHFILFFLQVTHTDNSSHAVLS
jgi:hypothetical protein